MRAIARLVAAGFGLATGLGSASALAQSSHSEESRASAAILEVPYLPQSVLLCGGAALAMVERWWGRRGVFAEDFSGLVRPEQGGILTTELAATARGRGWDTRILAGPPELVRHHLDVGEPVVALIQVSKNRYHYVVVLGWGDGKVTYHDPASAPFTTIDEARFLTRWTGADRWAMVVRPKTGPTLAPAGPAQGLDPAPIDSLPCSPWLDRAVDAAIEKQLAAAVRLLEEAGRVCPDEPLVLREMAGVRFKQGDHAAVIRLAEAYLALIPEDEAGWQLLASSRYLTGDLEGALAAWNELGRPMIDLIRIDGARRIRFRDIAAAASVPPGSVLTPSGLALAQRRVSEVPALRHAAVGYQPVPGGIVEVRMAIVERPVVDPLWRLIAAGAVRAAAQSEVGIEVASPTGTGELWSGNWRWGSARPRAAARVDLPGHLLIPGVIGIEGSWERFTVGSGLGRTAAAPETRRSGLVGFGGWLTAGFRPSASLRVERWSGQRDYLAASVGAEVRALGNRFGLTATSERAFAISAHHSYAQGSARAMWSSTPDLRRAGWSSRLGFEWASGAAPTGAWPLLGGAVSWAVPLRAHPLDGGELLAARRILHGGLAGDRPFVRVGPLVVAGGAFLDAAKLWASGDPAGDRWYLDGGVGVRVGIAEGRLGVLRVDLARSLKGDRRSAVTVGVHRTWPLFERSG